MPRTGFRFALALLLTLASGLASAQPPAVPHWPEDFKYLGSNYLPQAPPPQSVNGDSAYGKGLAVVLEADKTLTLYAGSWNPQAVLRWSVTRAADGTFGGPASFRGSVGIPPIHAFLFGIYFDPPTRTLYFSSQSDYDAQPAIDISLGRATIDPATGTLVPGGTFTYAGRSDKMTQGGTAAVPDWFQKLYPCGRLLAGWGGYWSVIANGPVSMGPAATCFDPPDVSVTSGAIANKPVLGYPFSSSLTVHTPAAERDIDYFQTYGWGWWPKSVTAEPGFWNPGDMLWQGCTWADTPAVSGLVCVPFLQGGCNWYGSNATPQTLPVCSPTPGKSASLNSQRARQWVYIYDPKDLGAVVLGQKAQNGIQAAQRVLLELPGVPQPLTGLPSTPRMVTGVTFEPVSGLLAIMVRNTSVAGGRPVIFWYQVRQTREFTFTATRSTTVTTTEQTTVTVKAKTDADALALAKAKAGPWTVVGTSSTSVPASWTPR